MSKRRIFKLTIYGSVLTGNEERQFEACSLAEAIKIKNTLLRGRPYYELVEIMEVVR